MKQKSIAWSLAVVLLFGLTACQKQTTDTGFDPTQAIVVVDREAGSGTKATILEQLQLEAQELSTTSSMIVQSTEVMRTAIASERYGIGYLSAGAMDASVKPLSVTGEENPFVRTFHLWAPPETTEAAVDFMAFLRSDRAGEVMTGADCTPVATSGVFESTLPAGIIRISGSSSVHPLMEQLIAAYEAVNPKVDFEVLETDSTEGIASVAEGVAHLAMTSRNLTEEERGYGLYDLPLATDSIVWIVHKDNPVEEVTLEQLRQILQGQVTQWEELMESQVP